MSEKNDFIQLPPIKKDTPSEVVSMIWEYLKLPKEFILLDAPGALCQEQKRQHNCVSSYIGRIEKGSCIIYSADINGEHVTIEIRYRKTRGKYTFTLMLNVAL